jgi:pimeloyl-ACP methyl ester carboxylesterase
MNGDGNDEPTRFFTRHGSWCSRLVGLDTQPGRETLLVGKTTRAAWRVKPSFYAISTEDRTINPDLQRFMANRMGAKTIEVKASHLSLISQPEVIAALILEAAGRSS